MKLLLRGTHYIQTLATISLMTGLRYLIILYALFFICCKQNSEDKDADKERTLLKLRTLDCYFEVDGVPIVPGSVDSLKPHSIFRAKLTRNFPETKDSLGNKLWNDFKGYFFEVSADTGKNWKVKYPFKKMNRYLSTRNDTAYIEIPTDTLYKFGYDSIVWTAGFNIISTENTNDGYFTEGKWILLK
jgi:hypothetical protein